MEPTVEKVMLEHSEAKITVIDIEAAMDHTNSALYHIDRIKRAGTEIDDIIAMGCDGMDGLLEFWNADMTYHMDSLVFQVQTAKAWLAFAERTLDAALKETREYMAQCMAQEKMVRLEDVPAFELTDTMAGPAADLAVEETDTAAA